jgi:NAD(P)H dehydrogenase (quinone)
MILITGATGHFGSLTIDFLLAKGIEPKHITALVRKPDNVQNLQSKGVHIVTGDYDDHDSLVKAFDGIDKLLLISGNDIPKRASQHENAIKAAKQANVKHIIYTSGERKDDTPDSPLWPFSGAHIKTEKWLQESGLVYTILKNTLYMDYIPFFIGNVLETNTIYLPAGNGKISVALRSEMAEAAATVLASEGHENKIYDIVNTESYSYADVARYISETVGRTIKYISPSVEEFTETLKKSGAGIPEEFLGIVLAQSQGDGDIVGSDLEKLIGRKPMSLEPFLQETYKV